MEPLREVQGRAIPFGRANVDTDVIIPAKWLKTITRDGLGRGAKSTLDEGGVTGQVQPETDQADDDDGDEQRGAAP